MADTYSVRGFTAATAGAASPDVICQLWNPDGAKRIKVLEVSLWRGGITGTRVVPTRTTARGTPGSTVTPDADNAWDTDAGPPSGALLDLAQFSVAPTIMAAPHLMGFHMAANTGQEGFGFVWASPKGIEVAPGTGLALIMPLTVVWPISETTWVWEE